MAAYNYSRKTDGACAKAVGRALPVSRKTSIELCRFLKGRKLKRVKVMLKDIIAKRQPVPLVRYFNEVGHKKGMAVGKFPVKAAQNFLMVVESAEANAHALGLSTASLVLYHAAAQKSHTTFHNGRHGRQAKRTHIEVILREEKSEEGGKDSAKKKSKPSKTVKKTPAANAAKKKTVTKEESKVEAKKEASVATESKTVSTADAPAVAEKKVHA